MCKGRNSGVRLICMGQTSKWTKAEMLDSSRSLLSAEGVSRMARILRSTHQSLDFLPTEVGCLF